ncbi:unnamed protein product [Rotaria socialis]|uniref:Uncharacterized protein n=1 Tax=Rotaria socialis TaxID=392032 RepID=A0A818UWF9_9BILA|nr:unnamed protein product [Rotaria socialis]CAF3704124.1 unnamed protein product [Rotaria socialis]CAF4177805.1 unnamed protein product [Rotaria socialis]CAF4337144.1 unnamed protein product [Rotaria socialis]CAF4774959.1 unnamed protein product [Rotaria socialis]
MNETDALNVCLSSTSGDGPLLYAYYFHMQSSAPSHAFINSLNASVLSSTEILVQWNVFVRPQKASPLPPFDLFTNKNHELI